MNEDLGLDGNKLNVAVTVFYGQSFQEKLLPSIAQD